MGSMAAQARDKKTLTCGHPAFLKDFLTPTTLLCSPGALMARQNMQIGRMGQTPIDRLKDYLGQLPPQSQALLMREFERAIARGEDTAVATLVLEQLRKLVRSDGEDTRPRSSDLPRLLFRPLDPFLVEANAPARPGQVRRASLAQVWQWLAREGAPEQVKVCETVLASSGGNENARELDAAIRKLQAA